MSEFAVVGKDDNKPLAPTPTPTTQINWATEDSDEDEEQNVDSDDDSDSESESDNEIVTTAKVTTEVSKQAVTPKKKAVDINQLSKKEREELRKKELDDLDALLSEMGCVNETATTVPVIKTDNIKQVDNDNDNTIATSDENKKKKKKKPTKKAVGTASDSTDKAVVVTETASTVVVNGGKSMEEIMKAKMLAKSKASKGTNASAIAQQEALNALKNDNKKKKKDKNKAPDYSY